MATILLASLGASAGAAIGGGFLGVSSVVLGQAAGALLGQAIDTRLMGGLSPIKNEGPRVESLDVMTSQEGSAIPNLAGRIAISGQVIWAAEMKETVSTEKEKVGSGKQSQTVTSTIYSYSASFAVSLGEGEMRHMGRIWIDGQLADLSNLIKEGRVRFYTGSETQMPDPMIEAIEGAAPAFRGTAYVVFEDLPLEEYGNRVPQVKVEVWGQSGDMEDLVTGVNVIPGASEWGYEPNAVTKVERNSGGEVISESQENAARHSGVSDWSLAMGMLDDLLPNCDTVSLVVSWFGTDLRAGLCEIEPRVEVAAKETSLTWSAGTLTRAQANIVSLDPEGRPAFGSAPSDASIVRAIQDLKARGKRVVLYPFIMMDITDAQALPDPSGAGVQGAYPWRGRIAPTDGQSVTAEINAFLGTAQRAHFGNNGGAVTYSGPNEWSYRRFILHLAQVAQNAGGVDAFLIGTEMRGLTMTPDAPGVFPFVDGLKDLAEDASVILPAAKIGYASDWSEYHSVRVDSEIFFHLDPLWSDDNIDFIGIDNYLPLSDWRPGASHLDFNNALGHTTPYSLDYLKSNIEGGEYWDWYYADDAARNAQDRTPIFDGAHGEDWVWRQKAIRDWHSNTHHNRPTGVRDASPTDWVPGSKPVWFTELGCPAVDFGANQPNVFAAKNSSESRLPYFSAGLRDDFMQRQFIRANMEWWAENGAGVVDPGDVQIWCWDSRPWPEFPRQESIWSDGPNWYLGHWLNGRAGAAPAAEAIRRRLVDKHGLTAAEFDLATAYGQADGYVASAPIGFREYAQPFEVALGLQPHEMGGTLLIESREAAITVDAVEMASLVDVPSGAPATLVRSALEDVAGEAILKFRDGLGDYERTASRAVIGAGPEDGTAVADLALVFDFDRGSAAAERLLRAAVDGRETASFRLPRSAVHLRPGLILPIDFGDGELRPMIIDRVTEGVDLAIEARSFAQTAFAATGGVFKPAPALGVRAGDAMIARFLNLPSLVGRTAELHDAFVATHAQPWPGGAVSARSAVETGGFTNTVLIPARATMSELVMTLEPGVSGVWTEGPMVVKVYSGELVGRPDIEVFSGSNTLAVGHPEGWELVQFRTAELVAPNQYELRGLLRGQRGTEWLAANALGGGAPVVEINGAVQPLGLDVSEAGQVLYHRTGSAARDASTHGVQAFTADRVAERPFSPVALTAVVTTGDTDLTWTRRTRSLADGWGEDEPPLDEATEAYLVEIGPEGAPVRTLEVTTPAATYTAAERSADGITAPFRVAVSQISASYGPGTRAEITVTE